MLIITERQFVDDHESFRGRIIDYLCSGHSRRLWGRDQLMHWMLRGPSPHLQYNNPFSRIEVCEALVEEVAKVVPQDKRYWLLSASPISYGYHDPKSGHFSSARLETFKAWIKRELFGLNYVAAIEGGWFGNYLQAPFEQPRVSFHFHAIVWGTEGKQVKAVADRIANSEQPFVKGMGISDHGQRAAESLDSYVRYIMKAPIKEYRLTNGPADQPPQAMVSGRSRPQKRLMRPGAACQMMRVIGGAGIADYMMAGGQGLQAMETALMLARRRLTRTEAKRRQRIERVVWGGEA